MSLQQMVWQIAQQMMAILHFTAALQDATEAYLNCLSTPTYADSLRTPTFA